MKVDFREGELVSLRGVSSAARQARERKGLSQEEAARRLGATMPQLQQAENQPHRSLFNLRKRMLERFTGFTLDGPYYKIKRKA